jgi:ABC-2 type transport system ATP-binding protein
LADVERLADRIAILDRGRIVALGSPSELTASSLPILRFRLADPLSEPDRVALAAHLAGARGGGPAGDRVTVEPEPGSGRHRVDGPAPTPSVVASLAAWCEVRGVQIVELRTGGGSLEERYLELIGAAGDDALDDDDGDDAAGKDDAEASRAGRRRRRGR